MKLIKDVCDPCSKYINIGQPLLECENCSKAIHTKCFRSAKFTSKNGLWMCSDCCSTIEDRYCPFPSSQRYDDSDKFYDHSNNQEDVTISKFSSILEDCKRYTKQELANSISKLFPAKNKNSAYLSALFCNIDGFASNFDSFLIEHKTLPCKFDVIGLAETNIDPSQQGLYQIPSYTTFCQVPFPDKKKGTGVSLYVSDRLNAVVIENLSHCTKDIECLFVEINLSSGDKLTYGVAYRPPNGCSETFCQTLEDISKQLSGKKFHILGDFNSNLLNVQTSSQLFEDTLLRNNMYPTISLATHFRPNCKNSCIDNILTSEIDHVLLSGVLNDRIGDHAFIFTFTSIPTENSTEKLKLVRYYDYSSSKLTNFVNELEVKVNNLTPSVNFNEFLDCFNETLDKHCKLDEPKVTKRTPKLNPWITDGIIVSVERKHELCRDWSSTVTNRNPEGNVLLYKVFSDYRRMLKSIIKVAKRSYYCNEIHKNIENSKKTWQIINELRGKKKKQTKPPFIINNERVMNRRVIANGFNSYFVSIAPKLNETLSSSEAFGLPILPIKTFYDFLGKKNEKSIMLEDCTPNEIMEIIKGFENGKASDIPVSVIKRSSHVITPILSRYINILMSNGTFPDVLKTGRITPVFKKGNPEEIENYRPISTLSIFGKIFEKIIYSRIYSFVSSQGIISKTQFGFRQSHSTSHAVNYSVNLITESLKLKHHVLGIFIDLSKAFDTIDHGTLLVKLQGYGIRGVANDLIKSYLTNRSQYTEVVGEKSDDLKIQFGVPQGSILGPLLFLLYMNDIANCSSLGSFVTFADDTNIFVTGKSKKEAYMRGNSLLASLYSYMRANKLHVNMSKCCFIHFKPASSSQTDNNSEYTLTIDNFPIKQVASAKFLGVVIDEKLTWEEHIKSLRRSLSHATSTLCRLRCSLPDFLHRQLYYTLFESHLSYCITVWGGAANTRISSVFKAQKYCLRVLFGDREAYLDKFKTCARARPFDNQNLNKKFFLKEHTKPLFKEHGILAVQNLYTYHCFLELYKIMKFRAPISLHENFTCSSRKPTLILSQADPPDNFNSRTTRIWNVIMPKLVIRDYCLSVACLKSRMKQSLLFNQHNHADLDWTNKDFECSNLNFDIKSTLGSTHPK